MYLHQATSLNDWRAASELLLAVVCDLHAKGQDLWREDQISLEGLRAQYKSDELYLAKSQGIVQGVVFLQRMDPYFWPEILPGESLFLHKLAIHPLYRKLNKGREIIQLAEDEASKRKLKWLRLDCDDREPLHRFYLTNNFSLLDIQSKDGFTFARYQRAIKNAAN